MTPTAFSSSSHFCLRESCAAACLLMPPQTTSPHQQAVSQAFQSEPTSSCIPFFLFSCKQGFARTCTQSHLSMFILWRCVQSSQRRASISMNNFCTLKVRPWTVLFQCLVVFASSAGYKTGRITSRLFAISDTFFF